MNTPNKLTLFRIIMGFPFLILMFIVYSQTNDKKTIDYENFSSLATLSFFFAGIIFIIAMVTDYIDGHLARKNNEITTFGKLFDPLADKIITTSAIIMLSIIKIIPFYIVLIFVLRDVLVDGFRNLAASKKVEVAASIYGKFKTMIMSIGIAIIYLIYPAFPNVFGTFGVFNGHYTIFLLVSPLFLAAVLSTLSGVLYFNQVKKYITIK